MINRSHTNKKMPKLNYGYTSLFIILSNYLPFLKIFDSMTFNKHKDTNISQEEYYQNHDMQVPTSDELLKSAPYQVFRDMKKDAVDLFKPYKGYYQFSRDLRQPIIGIGNIGKSTIPIFIFLFLTSIIFGVYWILYPISKKSADFIIKKSLDLFFPAVTSTISISWMKNACTMLFRGITQFIATPLTYLFKIPVRELITAVKGMPKIEDSDSIKQLVMEGNNLLLKNDNEISEETTNKIIKKISNKFNSGILNNQKTNINLEIYDEIIKTIDALKKYDVTIINDFNDLSIKDNNSGIIQYSRDYFNLFLGSPAYKFLLFSSSQHGLPNDVLNIIGKNLDLCSKPKK